MVTTRTLLLAMLLGCFVAPGSWGQDASQQNPQPQQPTQPDKPMQPSDAQEQKQPSSGEAPIPPVVAGNVTNGPITGANVPPLGIFSSRSYVAPAVEFYGQLDSNGRNTPFGSFATIDSLIGMIDLQKSTRFTQLNLDYMIGRSFSSTNDVFNSTTTALNVSELWTRGRWDGFISDNLQYSSQTSYLGGIAPFQVANFGSFADEGVIGPIILRNAFLPEQGIFTNFGPRLSNALVAQVNNHLSRRVFFTLVGNYNTLDFFNSGFINSSAAGFQAGIGYQRTHQDSVALIYRFNDLWFGGLAAGVRDNVIEVAYQRQVAERWNFEIGAGPDIAYIHAPNAATAAPTDVTRVSWAGDVSLHYEMRRTGANFGYSHYLTNGGGVFLGSERDNVYAGLGRELSRNWRVDLSVSYSRNKNLIPFPTLSIVAAPPGAVYNAVYGGVQFHRRVGRDSDLFFGYLPRYQTTNFTFCTTPTGTSLCVGPHLVGHLFNFGFIWRIKPVPIG